MCPLNSSQVSDIDEAPNNNIWVAIRSGYRILWGSLRIPPECVNQVSVQVDVSTKLVSGLGYRRSSKQQHLGCHAWRIFHDLDGQIESRSPAQNPRSSVFIGGQYGRPAITNASQSRCYWPVEVLAITNSSERQDLPPDRVAK